VLGSFESWPQIAAVNNLVPPYISSTGIPGTAAPGQQLIMPTTGTSQSSIGSPPSYLTNFLGVDLDFGPINGQMPPWSGDFQTVIGYQNLSRALGRRLQTTIGTLLFHPEYGSRIPPEVGAVQDARSAGQIAAFAASAISADPRIQDVLNVQAVPQPNFSIQVSAQAQPGGFNSTAVSVNEVIST
jgi:phage baseplate assembly protein W